MLDRFHRRIHYLRVSVTDRCNQRCIYCHREGENGDRPGEQMTADEIAMVAKVAASLGITKVKFTGGEPLTRRDMPQIIGKVAAFYHFLCRWDFGSEAGNFKADKLEGIVSVFTDD